MDIPVRPTGELYLVPRQLEVPVEASYWGELAVATRRAQWMLLNWPTERPVELRIVDSS